MILSVRVQAVAQQQGNVIRLRGERREENTKGKFWRKEYGEERGQEDLSNWVYLV